MQAEIKSRLDIAKENITVPEDTAINCPKWRTIKDPSKSCCVGYQFIASVQIHLLACPAIMELFLVSSSSLPPSKVLNLVSTVLERLWSRKEGAFLPILVWLAFEIPGEHIFCPLLWPLRFLQWGPYKALLSPAFGYCSSCLSGSQLRNSANQKMV